MPFDAFISYSSSDKIVADTTCALLENAGVRCWIAPRDVRPGTEYGAAIIDAIDQCRLMVLIFSSNANASNQIHREIERAASKGLPIIPVRIEDVVPTKSLEYFLGPIHWLDALTQPLEKHLQKLSETVKAILNVDASKLTGPIEQRARKAAGARNEQTAGAGDALPKQNPARTNFLWPVIAGSIAIGSIAAAIWFHQRNASAEKLCAGENAAKSIPSDTQSVIIFNNKTAAPIKLFWLDSQGRREFYGQLAPDEKHRQETYVNHVWVVTWAQNDCIRLYRAEAGTKEVDIGP
jgi:TIR domain/VHL beta domain